MKQEFPRMCAFRQNFPRPQALDLAGAVRTEFEKLRSRIRPGNSIGIGVGSRGITDLAPIVRAVVEQVAAAGAVPFIIPAMGSHGGATPEGQTDVLATFGITEATMAASIRPTMEVRQVGKTSDGAPVFCSIEALGADGIIVVNRVKPHTDFTGTLGSGLLKMCVIGLGKRTGAAAMHVAASRLGYEPVIRNMAQVLLNNAPILGGLAILENQFHETARLEAVTCENLEARESALLEEARRLMPFLPFEEIDLLIVDRLGKNISGAGMDPNVTGRGVQGYFSDLARLSRPSPFIRRIFVRDLTPETHGNAIGIGLADVTTSRVARAMDARSTYINALTSLGPQCAKVPIHFETDRESLQMTLASLALPEAGLARVVRIADTLSLVDMEASESLVDEIQRRPDLKVRGEPYEMEFDAEGNLTPLRASG